MHDEIERKVLNIEFGVVTKGLLIKRMQHRMAGAICRGAGALRDTLAVVRRHAAERPLIDPAVVGARKGYAVVLQLDDCSRRLLTHELDGVLVTEPVRALDGVVEVEAPVVLAHITERGRNPALRRDRMTAGREHLGQTSCTEAGFGEAERGTQPRAAGADDDDVVAVIDKFVITHGKLFPNQTTPRRATRATAYTSATANNRCSKVDASRAAELTPLPCT